MKALNLFYNIYNADGDQIDIDQFIEEVLPVTTTRVKCGILDEICASCDQDCLANPN